MNKLINGLHHCIVYQESCNTNGKIALKCDKTFNKIRSAN